MNRFTVICGIFGTASLVAGATLIYRPLGFIVLGFILLGLTFASARRKRSS